MRTKINLLALAAALIISGSLIAQAQTDKSVTSTNNAETNKDYSISPNNKTVTTTLPEKLVLNFNRTFPFASNAKWTVTADAFFANFSIDEKPVMASFNKKDEFVYALIYGCQADLSVSIQQDIRKNYPSFTVYKVVEIKTPETVNYQVVLHNSTAYVDLQVSQDGEIQETKELRKTKVD
jgi:hypothetical protein